MESASKIERLLQFWNQDPTNANLCIDIITEYGKQKNIEQLTQFYHGLSEAVSQQPLIIWQYGRALVELGNIGDGANEFAKLPDDQSETKPYSIALCLFLQNQFADADRVISDYVENIGQYSSAQLLLLHSKVKYHLGDLQNALALAEQIRHQLGDSANQNTELLGLLAMLNFDLLQISDSEKYAKLLLSIAPKHHDGLLALASIYTYNQTLKQAADTASIGVSEFANSGRMWSVLAQALFALGDRDSAYNCVINATKLMPNHIGTWHVRAWCELVANDYAQAKASFSASLELNRNFGESHAGLALVAFYEQQFEEAKRLLTIAQRLDPNSFTAKYLESLFLTHQGKPDASKQLIENLLDQPSHLSGLSYKQLIDALKR
ncbi:tetratricopeptide repeat protein [Agaribacter marinus]|uniref:Tetratricopeptide repeat protein n=1 Tax=Agaribacter marinus TaxID=1431249 RepID=A0AA37T1I6_9ALTE|nr:hypothetical protein [Agaribacter marinus]GLR70000.1 hypothetical protein GCM10007852_09080 [Agaribacter marinus]